ncbi:hypothetical protein TNIN_318071 [Trichonephila inaurata madagascariensis]|uniref:Uncharacterized protein n=1 Tax=Trichonephila inaurata madagascariensis TaxID=2747483 RepID=A0A8X7CQJ6_9ARAC|nr:hypothetical protein TNIN_318071 [Trichonephila inaurata madagascariensis]
MFGDLGAHFNNALSSQPVQPIQVKERYNVVGDVHSDTFFRHYGNEEALNHRRHKKPSVVWWSPCLLFCAHRKGGYFKT